MGIERHEDTNTGNSRWRSWGRRGGGVWEIWRKETETEKENDEEDQDHYLDPYQPGNSIAFYWKLVAKIKHGYVEEDTVGVEVVAWGGEGERERAPGAKLGGGQGVDGGFEGEEVESIKIEYYIYGFASHESRPFGFPWFWNKILLFMFKNFICIKIGSQIQECM